jgi:signal transduction histidine kinase
VHSLGYKSIIILSIAIAVMITSILYTDHYIKSISMNSIEIMKERAIVENLYALRDGIFRTESAGRGYVLTRQKEDLLNYKDSIAKTKSTIKLLQNIFIKESIEKQKELSTLIQISNTYEAKISEINISLNLANMEGNKAILTAAQLEESRVLMKKLNNLTDWFIKHQYSNIDKKRKVRVDNILFTRYLIFISCLIWISLVIVVLNHLLHEIANNSKLQDILTNEKIHSETKLAEQNALVRNLALSNHADIERERKKLSSELHDELGSVFTATKMDISWVIKKLKRTLDESELKSIKDKLEKTKLIINEGVSFQRNLIENLYPSSIRLFGIWGAIENLITETSERNNWELTLELPENDNVLDETISLVVYRLVQETLNNANKYSKAKSISVIIILDNSHLKLEINDDGIGINLSSLNGTTYGLDGMKNRVLAIGGKYKIQSEIGKGVFITAIIPISNDNN